jgi:D-3-phosphoglycerate dehydrogenase
MSVELVSDIDDALKSADFITLHMPLTDETRHLINEENAKLLKPDVRIINCARGGLLDEAAIGKAIEEGRVAGVALDVYETEPPPEDFAYYGYPNTILTPHLGASTQEAQENVGIEIARTIRDLILNGAVVNAVNMPSIDEKTAAKIGPYVNFAETLGRLVSQLGPKSCDQFRITYSGKVADLETTLISRSALKGFLEKATDSVNTINAPSVAESRGVSFTESRSPDLAGFTELIEVSAGTDDEQVSVTGTFYGDCTRARIVKVGDRIVEVEAEGTLLMIENTDAPGTVGTIGTLLGKHKVNIANMSLNRDAKDGVALTLFNLDTEPSEACVKELEALEGLQSVRVLRV